MVGALSINADETPILPELGAAYRQVGARTGVNWAALAAWDAAGNQFVLPVPTVDQIFAEKVRQRLAAKARVAEKWCAEHPEDAASCPADPPELTDQELAALWRSAHAAWRQGLITYIEGHAAALTPDFERDPEAEYGRLLGATRAARAAELFEGY